MFSNKDLERYSRQIILKKVGVLGQRKIQNAKVLVIGCGGLGTPVINLLCRAGIGEIGMMDHDKVSISNLHRQVMFNSNDVGKHKVNILKKSFVFEKQPTIAVDVSGGPDSMALLFLLNVWIKKNN